MNSFIERITYIDTAKGFFMLLVISYHIKQYIHINNPILNIGFSFMLPGFFIITGYFFNAYNNFNIFFKKKFKTILIPFIFFYITLSVILPNILYYIFHFKVANIKSIGLYSLVAFINERTFSNAPLWYLLSLFFVLIFFYLCILLSNKVKIFKNNLLNIGIHAICFWLCGIILSYKNILLPCYISTSFSAVIYLYFGYVLKHINIIHNINNKFLIILICILLCYVLYTFPVSVWYKDNILGHNYFITFFIGLTGTLFIIYFSKLFNNIPCVTFIGKNSLVVLCTHMVFVHFIGIFFITKIHLNNIVNFR